MRGHRSSLRSSLVSSCLELLWPSRCVGCDALVGGNDEVFCRPCGLSLEPIICGCDGCASPRRDGAFAIEDLAAGAAAGRGCSVCKRHRFAFSSAIASFEYGEALAAAIVRMKHGDRPDLAGRFAGLMLDDFAKALGHGYGFMTIVGGQSDGGAEHRAAGDDALADVLAPVPLHPHKLRRRGFNQALQLAQALLAMIPPGLPRPALERRLLVRVRDTAELGRSGPKERRAEVAGAFAVTNPERVRGRCFLVVDDVMTTGATLDECARTLLAAGGREVRVMALARAVA